MKKIITITEIVAEMATERGESDVCASAVAQFDEVNSRMEVELRAYLRPIDPQRTREHWHADWLPADEIVRETVAWEEVMPLAKDIFQSWVRKIRQTQSCLAQP